MGAELLDRYEASRASMEFADDTFRSLGASWSVIVAQAVVGHSSGEIAAAYGAGFLSKDSALRVAYFRGRAVETLLADPNSEKGGMLAVALLEIEIAAHIAAVVGDDCTDVLSSGCVNSPQNITITVAERYIDKLSDRLSEANIFHRKLSVPVAYHSPQMLKVADEYQQALEGGLREGPHEGPSTNCSTFISSVTGSLACHDNLLQPKYWSQNLVSKVRFSEALENMCLSSSTKDDQLMNELKPLPYVIEIGPHYTLERPVRETLNDKFYADLYKIGFQFGDEFQTLQAIKVNEEGTEATARVAFGHWREKIEDHELSEYLIHPATLDSLFHAIFAAQYKKGSSGGQLVFSEPTNRRMAITSGIFGVLSGWWLSTEENRRSGPLLSQYEWNEALI
ncbi:acyl transferase/acyl hydrolase/lysophospholipase [Jackrogersella minutella]|nr:acyl transferase/acyl hydrolase/lysophospholipase [Jackrogersella minutella]